MENDFDIDFPDLLAHQIALVFGFAIDMTIAFDRLRLGDPKLRETLWMSETTSQEIYLENVVKPGQLCQRAWESASVEVVNLNTFPEFLDTCRAHEGVILISHGDEQFIQFGSETRSCDEVIEGLSTCDLKMIDFRSCASIFGASLVRARTGIYTLGLDHKYLIKGMLGMYTAVGIQMKETSQSYLESLFAVENEVMKWEKEQ